jgi:hypothetical protein
MDQSGWAAKEKIVNRAKMLQYYFEILLNASRPKSKD